MTQILSLVVPCYNEEAALPRFYAEACRVVQGMGLSDGTEFVFVDDGSADGTLGAVKALAEKDARMHYVSFSRNFGKEAALYAGLSKARGDYTAVLDADLQDPPALLPQMLAAIKDEGYDCAATRRVTRTDEPPVRSFCARLFYKTMAGLSDVPVVDGARDFRLMTRTYKDAVLSLTEKNRFTKGIFPWVGFRTKWFAYENVGRVAGQTKWSFWSLFLYSIDGIIGFSTKPLALIAVAGVLAIVAAIALVLFIAVRRIVSGDPVQGWASTACIIVFTGGLQLSALGITGLYISKIYTEIKNRPLFIVREEH